MSDGAPVKEPPAGDISIWDIDPYAETVLSSPRNYYTELRARGPLVWLERYGMWACGRYDEVKTIFSDWERFCSARGVGLTDFKTEEPWRPPSIILEVDPPEHDRTRAVMMRTLSSRAVDALVGTFRAEADSLIGELVQRDSVDAVPSLAQAFPLKVFPDAVGVAEDNRENLLTYANMVFNALGPDNQVRRNAMVDAARAQSWIADKCERSALANSGFGATIYAATDTGEITYDEARLLVRSLLSAGVDTTVAAIGNTLLCLAQHPDQWALLKGNLKLLRNTFEEVLRYTSPIHTFCRTATAYTEVSGVPIREGDKVLCVLAAANLDSARWRDADKFDIQRPSTGHVAFGMGIHACVGRQVARQEAHAILRALVAQVDRIELTGKPVWRPGNSLTMLASLPISLVEAA